MQNPITFAMAAGMHYLKAAVSILETTTRMIEESPEYKAALQAAQVSLEIGQRGSVSERRFTPSIFF